MGFRNCFQSFITLFLLLTFVSFAHSLDGAVDNGNLFSPLDEGCPQSCSDVGSDPSKWTEIHSWGELSGCSEQLLFGLNILNPPSEFATMQTCSTASSAAKRDVALALESRAETPSISNNCGAETATTKLPLAYGPSGVLVNGNDVGAGAELLAQYLVAGASCGPTILFAKSGSAVVGIYVGAEVQKSSAADLIRQSRYVFFVSILTSIVLTKLPAVRLAIPLPIDLPTANIQSCPISTRIPAILQNAQLTPCSCSQPFECRKPSCAGLQRH